MICFVLDDKYDLPFVRLFFSFLIVECKSRMGKHSCCDSAFAFDVSLSFEHLATMS